MTTLKANCILLNVRGKYYYAEELGKFIEIEEWEYDRILNNPCLYYFSTALKKHFEWCAEVGKARTLTFSEALGYSAHVQEEQKNATENVPPPEQGSTSERKFINPCRIRPGKKLKQLKREIVAVLRRAWNLREPSGPATKFTLWKALLGHINCF